MAKADKTPKAPELRELAETTNGRDITRGFVLTNGVLLPEDSVLSARGGDFKTYEIVRSDDQVQATFQQRRLAVTSREWEVLPGGNSPRDKEAAEFLKQQLDHVGWDKLTEKMLWGVFYGFAVAECLWARDGARIVLDQVKVRNRRRFRFDQDGGLRLLTTFNTAGELMPPRKFWTFATGADHDDDPYGLGLAHWLYWPVYFKRYGIKFWMIFLEKLGMPTTKGVHPPGATAEEKSKLLAALAALQTDSAIIVPEGVTVELLEAARSSTPDYKTLVDKMDSAISKVIVGQTMTTDDGSSLSQASIHMEVRQDIVKSDADLINESFNLGPVRWLMEWNYPDAALPKVFRRIEEEPDLKPQAERDAIIAGMGFKPTLKYVIETYGGEWAEADKPQPPSFGQLSFAEGALPRDSADEVTDQAADQAAAAIGAMIADVKRLVETSASLQEVSEGLLKIYPKLKGDQLAAVMQQAMAVADLAGRAEILDGR